MNELALFAGAGGGILGGKMLGWRTVCAVEYEPYPASVLMQRQNEGFLQSFPIWDDVRTFDGRPWQGIVNVVSGGFPCQDISSAGKGEGLAGAKSSMWFEMLRIINEVKPEYVFIENSPNLRTRGLVTVLQGLAKSGYNAAWGVLSAEDCGANHQRKRMWIVGKLANPEKLFCNVKSNNAGSGLESKEESKPRNSSWSENVSESCFNCQFQFDQESLGKYGCPNCEGDISYPAGKRLERHVSEVWESEQPRTGLCGWWQTEPDVGRVADAVASRVDRLKAIGNGQVPIVAATAFMQLKKIVDGL